jgi:SAM-dependent methyltransferase
MPDKKKISRADISFFNSIRPKSKFWENDLIYARFIKLYGFALSTAKDSFPSTAVVLDAASGLGYGAKLLNTYFETVYGIDFSNDAVTYAKDNYPGPVYKKGNVLALPFQKESFEAVFSIETMEHLQKKDLKTYLGELLRVTKKNGLIFISTPNKPVYSALHTVPDHFSEMDINELRNIIPDDLHANIEYYEFGRKVGKSLRILDGIDKFSHFARRACGRVIGRPFPRNLNLRQALRFWDIPPLQNSKKSLGYLNIAVIKLQNEGNRNGQD